MNSLLPLFALLALATAPTEKTTSAPVSAVPTEASASASEAAASAPAADSKEAAIPKKIPSPDAEQLAPTVSIRTGDNGDLIEEYRQGNNVTMVRIKPKNGPPYMLMDSNGDGRLDKVDGLSNGGVSPVYWTLYKWN